MDDMTTVTMPRDTWLLLLGWMAAKRPETEWDPGFLAAAINEISRAAGTSG